VMMKLEKIGFYTLSDKRAKEASESSRLSRCELLLTSRCNFRCPYCRNVGGDDIPFEQAAKTVRLWAADGLYAIRFSGGEPLLYPKLKELVELAKASGIEKIAVSSNGSLPLWRYEELLAAGVNDLSISLDACCAEDGEKMTGGVKGAWEKVTENIRALSKLTYLTVGVVLTDQNAPKINEIIRFAASLGVGDIRVIPAAQDGDRLKSIVVDQDLLEKYPILRYRMGNLSSGRPVRGLQPCDSTQCGLALDDMAVCGTKHYPCIIYLREGGAAIGEVGPNMRHERAKWYMEHNTHEDRICQKNCLDVCVDYNNRFCQLRVIDQPCGGGETTKVYYPYIPESVGNWG
jgi:MoaA/NifB/PqqE/SkfB family radical SAM enzyme